MERLTQRQVLQLSQLAEVKRVFNIAYLTSKSVHAPCIMVTSARRGEGKTTTTALLAACAAQPPARRVLAVDLNWHQPALHACFGLERSFNIDEFREEQSIDGLVRRTSVPGLDVLTAPPPIDETRSASLDALDVGLMILEKARARYEWVFVDSNAIIPPNRRMIDPVVVSQATSGVIVVVLASVTSRQDVKRTVAGLETSGSNVVGTFVNQWRNPLYST
jgi:protein-tyrosine kinase